MTVRHINFNDIELQPDPLLFHGRGDLRDRLDSSLDALRTTIQNWDADHLLRTPEHDVADELVETYGVECPALLRDHIEALPTEEGYSSFRDGFGDQVRQRIAIRRFIVPFTGDADVFALQASTHTLNPPRATVQENKQGGGELRISLQALQGQVPSADQIRQAVHTELDKIVQHLEWSRSDIAAYQQRVRSAVEEVTARKQEILRERDLQAAIGFPVRRRDDAATYAVPVRRKTIATQSTSKPRAPFAPEPAIADHDFETVLRVLTASRNQLERTPSMTSTLTEEKIRDLLLVNLNAQFEGAAAGEVFNGAGKTTSSSARTTATSSSPNARSGKARRPSPTHSTSCSATWSGATPRRRCCCLSGAGNQPRSSPSQSQPSRRTPTTSACWTGRSTTAAATMSCTRLQTRPARSGLPSCRSFYRPHERSASRDRPTRVSQHGHQYQSACRRRQLSARSSQRRWDDRRLNPVGRSARRRQAHVEIRHAANTTPDIFRPEMRGWVSVLNLGA